MTVRLYEGDKTETGGAGIEITDNKVVNLLLRSLNNLIKINADDEAYVDLQLEDGIDDDATMPVGVNVGRVLQADGWLANGTLLVAKTTSGDEFSFLFADDGKLYTDNGTGTFKQIYLKPEIDAMFQQLRSELSTVAFSGDYGDLLNKPTLGTAAALDIGSNPGNIPVIKGDGRLDPNIVPSTGVMTTYTVTNKSDLTTLSTAVKGDIGIVTSENKTYILSVDPYSTLANWTELLFPTGSVSSVNGFTGAVNLTTGYISESNNVLFVSPTEKATWNNKLGANQVSTVALSGNYGDLNNKPTIDTAMSDSSTNAVQNKIIKAYVDSTSGSAAAGVVSDTAYGSSWDGDTTHAPSKNAVYDEIASVENSISTINTNITNLQGDTNTKTFTLSGTTGQTALDDATAIYAWRSAGKTPIVKYLNTDWYWITSSFANGVQLSSFKTTATNGTSTTTIERKSIDFIVDGNGNVTSISTGTIAVASVLNTGQNYGTPYTPTYNGSPATKKYVDDKVAAGGGLGNIQLIQTVGSNSSVATYELDVSSYSWLYVVARQSDDTWTYPYFIPTSMLVGGRSFGMPITNYWRQWKVTGTSTSAITFETPAGGTYLDVYGVL